MKFIIKILFLLSAIVAVAESEREVCNYCYEPCVKVKMSDTLKILRRLEKRDELDTYKNEKESTTDFDIDIAEGKATVYKSEVSNILSAEIDQIKIFLNNEKTEMIMNGTMIIPELYVTSYGRSIFKTRNTDKMKGLNGLLIPPEIDTIGTMKAVFRNTPFLFTILYEIQHKDDNKVCLDPITLHGTMSCANSHDSDYDYEPNLDSGDAMKRAIEKAYFNAISSTKSEDFCNQYVENKNSGFDDKFLKDFKKYFGKVLFGNDC